MSLNALSKRGDTFQNLTNSKIVTLPKPPRTETLQKLLNQKQSDWNKMQKHLNAYTNEPSDQNEQLLFEASNQVLKSSNSLVLYFQNNSMIT